MNNIGADLKTMIMSKVQRQDIVHKAFLRPVEVLLTTNRVDSNVEIGELPQGLRIALKMQGINDNSYEAIPIKAVSSNSFKSLK